MRNVLPLQRSVSQVAVYCVFKDMGSCSQEVHGTAMKLFSALSSLFTVHNAINFPLSFECLGALLRLHDPQIIPMWNPESPIATLWDVR